MVVLALVVIGFSLMFSRDFAKSLIKPFFGLVIVATFGSGLVNSCAHSVPSNGSVSSSASLLIGLLILIVIVSVTVAAWVRYVHHRRQLAKFLGSTPTSQKRRVDRGP